MKVARPVLNGEDEETGRKALRLVLTQRGELRGSGAVHTFLVVQAVPCNKTRLPHPASQKPGGYGGPTR